MKTFEEYLRELRDVEGTASEKLLRYLALILERFADEEGITTLEGLFEAMKR